ncbi:MAG: flagellar export protein FliJ [Limnochordia bacterium]|jgi:flagellar export protein FliJ|nr:flagellar export protein FliJ [Limnochordia bacterium]MDD2629918.1 flagellar export protein FliJ [Limnochordia bacterium]MDD4516935.1 flagellar export protein FliJ [Limnochordia bacterium]
MRSFQFSLDKLLQLHEAEKKQKQAETAKALLAVEKKAQRIAKLHQDRQDAFNCKEESSVVYMQLNSDYRQGLSRALTRAHQELEVAALTHEQQQDQLQQTTKNCKVLALLKERQREMHRKAMQRQEQKMLDEFASFARVRGERG